jgi:hypothetical protein
VRDFGARILGHVKGPIYVDNLPFAILGGPFILKDYDFRYAFQDRWQGVDVAYRYAALAIAQDGNLAVQGYWEPPLDAAGRTRVSVDLCLGHVK